MKERFALLAAYFKEKLAIGKKSGKEKRKLDFKHCGTC